MKVNLVYYRPTGKYEHSASYETEQTVLFKIWDEVAQMASEGRLPGMIEGHGKDYYIISVDVPGHEHEHPHLVMPTMLTKPFHRIADLETALRETQWDLEDVRSEMAEKESKST